MNSRPIFAALAVLFCASCKDEPEETFVPYEDRLEMPFLMPVEDVFTIHDKGVTVTGKIERGVVEVGDEIEVVGILDTKVATVTGVEMFREIKESGKAGENVGLSLSGVTKDELQRGMVLAETGSITAHTHFEADVKLLSADEGGRATPIFNGYRPQYYFRTTDVTGVVTLPEGTESVKPGEKVSMTVKLNIPTALEVGTNFAVREGSRTMGTGVITAILEEEEKEE